MYFCLFWLIPRQADQFNHRIRSLDLDFGLVATLAGFQAGFADGTGISAFFHFPASIVVDPSNVFALVVSDTQDFIPTYCIFLLSLSYLCD